jgi:hypothetical protein
MGQVFDDMFFCCVSVTLICGYLPILEMLTPVHHQYQQGDRENIFDWKTNMKCFMAKILETYVTFKYNFCISKLYFGHFRLSMTRSQFADGGDDLQILRVAANIFNKRS